MASVLASIHAALAVAALTTWTASRLVRRRDAALWHAVWTAIAVAAIAAPMVAAVVPAWQLSVSSAAAAGVTLVIPKASAGATLLQGFAVVYAAGTVLLLLRLAAGLFLVRRLVRQSYAVAPHWRARLERLAGPGAARCATHPRVQVPLTVGLRRGLVLLPESWIDWDDERVSAVLQHELTHVARRDYAWHIAAAVAQAFYWPNPLTWLVTARLRLTAELACDREASSALGTDVYAGVLVASARDLIGSGGSAARLAPGAVSNLDARVRALLSSPARAGHAPVAARLAVAMVVGASVLAAAMIKVTPQAQNGPLPHPNHLHRH